MKRVLGALLVVCGTSGCYTVLRHPEVERGSVDAYQEFASEPGPMQDCAACHDAWMDDGCASGPLPYPPRLLPYPPLWLAYSTGPWWQRARIEQPQGHALVNTRPRPAVNPPPPVPIDVPVAAVTPVVKPPSPGLASVPAASPHPGIGSAQPGVPVRTSGGRDSGRAGTPHAAPDPGSAAAPRSKDPAPVDSPRAPTPAPAVASTAPPPAQGQSLPNARARPR